MWRTVSLEVRSPVRRVISDGFYEVMGSGSGSGSVSVSLAFGMAGEGRWWGVPSPALDPESMDVRGMIV